MITKEYVDFVWSMSHKEGQHMPLAVCALGLAGECGEVADVLCWHLCWSPDLGEALVRELGDLLFYTVATANACGLSAACVLSAEDTLHAPEANAIELTSLVGAVCERVKKAAWHGQRLDVDSLGGELAMIVQMISIVAAAWARSDLAQVVEANMSKLKARYPGGFSEGGGVR